MYNDMLKETFEYEPTVPLVHVPCNEGAPKTDPADAQQKNNGGKFQTKFSKNELKTDEEKSTTETHISGDETTVGVDKKEPEDRPYETLDNYSTDNKATGNDDTDLDETEVVPEPNKSHGNQIEEKELAHGTSIEAKLSAEDRRNDRKDDNDALNVERKDSAGASKSNTEADALNKRESTKKTDIPNDEHTILDRTEKPDISEIMTYSASKADDSDIDLDNIINKHDKISKSIISDQINMFQNIKTQANERKIYPDSALHNPKAHTSNTKLPNPEIIHEDVEYDRLDYIKYIDTMEGENNEQDSGDANDAIQTEDFIIKEKQYANPEESPTPPQDRSSALKTKINNISFGLCFISVCVKTDIFNINAGEPWISQRKKIGIKISNTKRKARLLKRYSSRKSCIKKYFLNYFSDRCLPVKKEFFQSETAVVKNKIKRENTDVDTSMKVKSLEEPGRNNDSIAEAQAIYAEGKHKSRNKRFVKCPPRNSCNGKCHLTYSHRHCLSIERHVQHQSTITENIQTSQRVKSNTTGKHPTKCLLKHSCNKNCYLVYLHRHCLPVDKLRDHYGKTLEIDYRSEHETGNQNFTDNKPVSDKQQELNIIMFTESIQKNSDEQTTREELNVLTTKQSAGKGEPTQDVHMKKEIPQTNQEIGAFPYERLEKIVNQQTNEYGQKIQTLELMIIKLENQVLIEKLDKQNHSSTIMRLENMILKLENDLLRMYKNYETLKQESEHCTKQHHQFLEIVQKQEKKLGKYPELPDKTSESLELISKHQLIIKQLSETINNQSIILAHMKIKSDYIEEQNNILRQMITNQTVFMNQIVQHVTNLTEQNVKYKGELDNLRTTINRMNSNKITAGLSNISESEKFMKDLDSLASDRKIRMDNIDINTDNKHKLRSPEAFCNYSCMLSKTKKQFSCYYYSVVNENNLVPYKALFWEKCSDALSAEFRQETSNVNLPKVSDNEAVQDSNGNEEKETIIATNPEDEVKHLRIKQNHGTNQLVSERVMTQINIFENLYKFKSMIYVNDKLHKEDIKRHIIDENDLQSKIDTSDKTNNINMVLTTKTEHKRADAIEDKDEENPQKNYDNSNDKDEKLTPSNMPNYPNSNKEKNNNIPGHQSLTNQHQTVSVSVDNEKRDQEHLETVLDSIQTNMNQPKSHQDNTPNSSQSKNRKITSDKVSQDNGKHQTNARKELRHVEKEESKEKKGKMHFNRKTPIYLSREQKEPKGKSQLCPDNLIQPLDSNLIQPLDSKVNVKYCIPTLSFLRV